MPVTEIACGVGSPLLSRAEPRTSAGDKFPDRLLGESIRLVDGGVVSVNYPVIDYRRPYFKGQVALPFKFGKALKCFGAILAKTTGCTAEIVDRS
jgi:hypothetical protein